MFWQRLIIGLLMRMALDYELKNYYTQVKTKGVKGIMTNPIKTTKPGGLPLLVTGVAFFANELGATIQQLNGVQDPTVIDIRAMLVLLGISVLWAVLQTTLNIFGVKGEQKVALDQMASEVIGSLTGGKLNPTDATPDTQVNVQNVAPATPAPSQVAAPAPSTPQSNSQSVQSDIYTDESGTVLNPIATIVPTTEAQ